MQQSRKSRLARLAAIGLVAVLGLFIIGAADDCAIETTALTTTEPAPKVAHLTPNEFEEAAVIHGVTAQNIGELKYWQEAWVHWDELDSIGEYSNNVFADGVMDLNEGVAVCSVLPQWLAFIETTETYLKDYEAFAPEQLAGHHAALNLEPEAVRIRTLLAPAINDCAFSGF